MNDEELGVALRDALEPPDLTADRWAGQRLRRRVRDRRAARGRLAAAASVVVVVVAMIGGLTGLLGPGGTDDAGGGGESGAGGAGVTGLAATGTTGSDTQGPAVVRSSAGRTLSTPVRVLEVRSAAVSCPDPSALHVVPLSAPGAGCVVVGPPVLTIRQVAGLRVVQDASPPVLQLDLLATDATTYAAYTRGHVAGKIAFVVDGRALSAPEILGPVTGPTIDVPVDGGVDVGELYERLGGK